MYRKIFLFFLIIPVVFGIKTCSYYWGDCSSRTINDAFPPCNGIEVGGDEHVDEIYIYKEIVEPNETQVVTCTFTPSKYWSLGRTYIFYFDGSEWIKLLEEVPPYRYKYNRTVSFNVGEKEGEKIVRCIISRDPIKGVCANESSNYDNDDIKFLVLKPLDCNISCSEKKFYTREDKIRCEFSCNKEVRLFYSCDGKNETLAKGRKGSFEINFLNFDFGGNYGINIFAEKIFSEKIYTINVTLKSRAIIAKINVSSIAPKKGIIFCEVRDSYSNKKLENYEVSFFADNRYLGSNLTKRGVARFLYQPETSGEKNISCSIKDSEFYFANDTKKTSFYFLGSKIEEEIKRAREKFEKLEEEYYDIYVYSNLSKEFSVEIEVIKKELDELESYLNSGDIENFEKLYPSLKRKIDSVRLNGALYIIKRNILSNKIFWISIFIILAIPFVFKFYKRRKRILRELEFYKNMEKNLIEKRREIERDYFSRKINESYFNKLMLENYSKLAKVRAKIKELSKKNKLFA